MTVFELRASGVESNSSTNWATTTDLPLPFVYSYIQFIYIAFDFLITYLINFEQYLNLIVYLGKDNLPRTWSKNLWDKTYAFCVMLCHR